MEKNIIFNVIFLKNNRFSLKKKFDLAEKKLYFNQDFINIVFLMRLSFLSFLSKKVKRYGHILRPVQVKKDKKKVRLGEQYAVKGILARNS